MTVKILMSAFNGAPYIREQLDSILAQDYKEWELFVRDDGSTDDTVKILGEYEKYPQIRITGDGKNLGPAQSFLALLNETKGRYFMFCDQDDYWIPQKISILFSEIQKAEAMNEGMPILVFSDAEVVDEGLKSIHPSFWDYTKMPPQLLQENPKFINIFNSTPGCTMMWNAALKDALPHNLNNVLMHDWLLMITALKYGQIRIVPKSLMLYRQHSYNVLGAQKTTPVAKMRTLLKNIPKAVEKQLAVYRFVSQFSGISLLGYYLLKLKFNILRHYD